MSICIEISEALQKGRTKAVKELVQRAVEEGVSAVIILNDGLLVGMEVMGEKFKNNDVYVPEVLMAAKAMNGGMEILKPLLAEDNVKPIGKAVIGTVKGDMHDIGKNLVRMMFEGKGIEVLDLGSNVSAEQFYEGYEKLGAQIIACSALLTTTMNEMENVVKYFTEKGARDKVTIMVGGAPITDNFCKSIGADYYTPDAATAADVAKQVLIGA